MNIDVKVITLEKEFVYIQDLTLSNKILQKAYYDKLFVLVGSTCLITSFLPHHQRSKQPMTT